VFENRALRRIFGPKGDEVTGGWRKLHNGNFHSSPSIIIMIKPRRIRRVGHVEREGEKRIAYGLLMGKPEERRPIGRLRHLQWIIFRWIFQRYDGVVGLG
jgi:hypothetical protein